MQNSKCKMTAVRFPKAKLSFCILHFAFCISLLGSEVKPEPNLPKMAWFSDVQNAIVESHEKNQPILLLLELPDQAWSRQLVEKFSDEAIAKLAVKFTPVRVNVSFETQLLDTLVVRIIPDLRVFNAEGKQVAQETGLLDAPALKAFLEKALKAAPESGAPSLGGLFPSVDLDALLKLEQENKTPSGANLQRLIEQAGGPAGETRVEAQRLLHKWAHALAPNLAELLADKKLKLRLTACDVLSDLQAPLTGFDPWAGPADAALLEKLKPWAAGCAAMKFLGTDKPDPNAELPARVKAQVEADLAEFTGDDAARSTAAWQRLVSAGRTIVPLLRAKARDLTAHQPEVAAKYDELRFRLLLNPEALRKNPAAARKLASGSPGSRAALLTQILKSGAAGLDALAREAACDRDPLFRETAIRNASLVMDSADLLLRDALADPEPNVRVAALTTMATLANKENTDALTAYLSTEKDADMICHAIDALAGVDKPSTKSSLRKLLGDPRWQVQAAAVEALGKLNDHEATEQLEKLLEGDDGFVASRAVEALLKIGDESILPALEKAVQKHPNTTSTVLKGIGHSNMRKAKQADKMFRKFTKSDDPAVRAQAILALAGDSERPAYDEIAQGLKDTEAKVRAAAVEGMRSLTRRDDVRKMVKKNNLPSAYTDVREQIAAMLNDPDDDLRMQCVLTLAYFGDVKLAEKQFGEMIVNPKEALRAQAYYAFEDVGAARTLEGVKLRLSKADALPLSEEECNGLIYQVSRCQQEKASQWDAGNPGFEAILLLLPRLPKAELTYWFERAYAMGVVSESSSSNDRVRPADQSIFAVLLEERLKKLEPGPQTQVLKLLWLRVSDLSNEQLQPYLADPDLEIRRMALVKLFRAADKGPDAMVLKYIADPAPELRRVAVAAAIPRAWREFIENPIVHELVGGELVELSDNREYFSHRSGEKAPKVVELPVETLDKLLKDEDKEVRETTAFLMAMEGGDHGIPVLMKRWKTSRSSYRDGEALIKALVLAWDDSLTPYVQQMYEALPKGERSYELRQLNEAIQPLQGAQIKKLRAKMKAEVGDL